MVAADTRRPEPAPRQAPGQALSPPVRFGTVTFTEDYDDYLRWLAVAEELGYEIAGHGDSQSLWSDVYVSLAVAARATSRIRIGTLVTNPVTRHPAVTAGAAASLQKLSGGRMFLGIGTGDSALANIGESPATVAAFASYCQAVSRLCAGEEADWNGDTMRMSWPVEPVPLWISAEGPRMLRLAGQIADGVIVASGIGADVIDHVLGTIREGAEGAGRSIDDIEIWWMLKPYLAPSEEEAWRDLRWTLAGTANHLFRFTMADKFVPPELHQRIRDLQRGYAANTHGKVAEGAHNARLVDQYGLTEWLGRRFALAGPPEVIIERIRELARQGVTRLLLPQFVPDRIAFMRRFDEAVVSAFR
jgi:5,10-methylenetetrahydromethanopterin reductase